MEFKWDRVRVITYVSGGRLRLVCRNGDDMTDSYPGLGVLAERQRIDTPTPRANRCSASWGHRTALRCTRLHRFPAAAFFYPERLRSGAEMSYLLVTAAKSRGSAGMGQQLPKLIVRVRFPSPAPSAKAQVITGFSVCPLATPESFRPA